MYLFFSGGGATPAPPTPLVVRIVLLHKLRFVQSFFSPTVYYPTIERALVIDKPAWPPLNDSLYETANNAAKNTTIFPIVSILNPNHLFDIRFM